MPVALQYCIAALVRLEIGPWLLGCLPGTAPRASTLLLGGFPSPTPINHCGGSDERGLGVVTGAVQGEGATPGTPLLTGGVREAWGGLERDKG